MDQEKGMEIVNRLIVGLQRARSASREGVDAIAKGKSIGPEIVDGVLEDLTPWLHGSKAESLLNGLMKVQERGSVSGMELFNFMTIIHVIDPKIASMAGILADYTFPFPTTNWIMELGI
jgi:hypothetical protein